MQAWMREAVPDHPFLTEHEGTMFLRPEIHVHHINLVRDDNQRENLVAIEKMAHMRLHRTGTRPKPWECWPSTALPEDFNY
jgi:hypothetical protein